MANEEVLELQIRDNAADAAVGLALLSNALTRVKNAVGKGLNLKGAVNSLERLKSAVNNGLDENSVARFERLASTLERLKTIGALRISGIGNIKKQLNIAEPLANAKQEAEDAMSGVVNAVDRGMENVDNRAGNIGNSIKNALVGLKDKIKEVWSGLTDVKDQANQSGKSSLFEGLKDGAKSLSEKIKQLISDFGRIVKYRAIRSIIKNITEGFNTGVENVYNYSKAIGSSFAPAMDDAASVMLQFKNSIGAAVYPLIQELIPYLKMAVNAVIEFVNWINQAIALLRGQNTWTKAIYKQTDAFEDQTKKAKKNNSALKELLADWDELNIIQSDTGSGNNGSGKVVEDYTKMFEESSEFSSDLKRHLNDIVSIVKKIGALVAAWKFSKLFTGFLNKLFKLAAGGLLVSIGLDLSYNAGFDAGANGWDARTIIQAIIGSLATAIGGSLITTTLGLGGALGFGIGLVSALMITLVGYVQGKKDMADRIKWGNVTMTAEQLEQFVRDRFTFDVVSEIEVLDNVITNAEEAKRSLNNKVRSFSNALNKIKIHADKSPQAVIDAGAEAKEVIGAVNTYLDTHHIALETGLKLIPIKDTAGEDMGDDILKNVTLADTQLSDWFTEQGNEIANWIDKGITNQWKGNEAEMAMQLMDHIDSVINQAESNRVENEMKSGLLGNIAMLDRDNAEQVLNREIELLKEYQDKAQQLYEQQIAGLYYKADLAEAIGLVDSESGKPLADLYREQAALLQSEYKDAILGKIATTKEELKKEWAQALLEVYGGDTSAIVKEATKRSKNVVGQDVLTPFEENLKWEMNHGGKNAGIEAIRTWLDHSFAQIDTDGNIMKIMQEFGVTAWDMLDEAAKSAIRKSVAGVVGSDDEALELIMAAFGLDFSDFGEEFKKTFDSDKFESEVTEELQKTNVEVEIPIEIEPKAEIEDMYEELRKQILHSNMTNKTDALGALVDLYNSGDLDTMKQLKKYVYQNGVSNAFDMLENYKMGNDWSLGKFGYGALASAGMGDVRYKPYVVNPESDSAQSDEKMIANMESSMKRANEPQNDLLGQLISIGNRILQKDTTVYVSPSAQWGQFSAVSGRALTRVTGD